MVFYYSDRIFEFFFEFKKKIEISNVAKYGCELFVIVN